MTRPVLGFALQSVLGDCFVGQCAPDTAPVRALCLPIAVRGTGVKLSLQWRLASSPFMRVEMQHPAILPSAPPK
jgi:hypothetical protein